jgi:hypothetical protein
MKPEAFVAEVYRRMSLRMVATTRRPPAETMIDAVAREYSSFLPAQKDAAILDIGFGVAGLWPPA